MISYRFKRKHPFLLLVNRFLRVRKVQLGTALRNFKWRSSMELRSPKPSRRPPKRHCASLPQAGRQHISDQAEGETSRLQSRWGPRRGFSLSDTHVPRKPFFRIDSSPSLSDISDRIGNEDMRKIFLALLTQLPWNTYGFSTPVRVTDLHSAGETTSAIVAALVSACPKKPNDVSAEPSVKRPNLGATVRGQVLRQNIVVCSAAGTWLLPLCRGLGWRLVGYPEVMSTSNPGASCPKTLSLGRR